MCGIFGFWLNRPLSAHDVALGKAGTDMLNHRGPDHSGCWIEQDAGLFLGHTRLSIIDLSDRSNQPMVRHGAALAYNGEIYNYKELAKELSQDVRFTTHGDVEVLLESWHKWGVRCVDRFDGMFAFALYQNQRLHLVTDPFGEKPLYYVNTPDGVYFASEANPLVRLLRLRPEFSSSDIAAFLNLGFLPAPSTGYKGLHRMEPGTWLTVSPGSEVKKIKYWAPPPPMRSSGPIAPLSENCLDIVVEALIESLSVRLRADVPLGIFLSSGVDSALIAAIAAKELNRDTLAFTVKFSDGGVADESENASAIADYLGLPHKVVESQSDGATTVPNLIFDLFGEVNDNVTAAAAYQMSLAATASNLKVALSGIGGDEIFYGYNKYQALFRWRRWLGLPQPLRKFISHSYRDFLPRRGGILKDMMSASDPCRFIAMKNLAVWPWLQKLPGLEESAATLFPNDGIPIELLGRHFDLTQTLPANYIPAIERSSMRTGLEVRTPYLNRRLLEVVSQLDQRAFVAFGQKSVLRRLLARYLPTKIVDLPKQGFNYPLGTFLRNFTQMPDIPILERSMIEQAWQRRFDSKWQTLNVRLLILSHFI